MEDVLIEEEGICVFATNSTHNFLYVFGSTDKCALLSNSSIFVLSVRYILSSSAAAVLITNVKVNGVAALVLSLLSNAIICTVFTEPDCTTWSFRTYA